MGKATTGGSSHVQRGDDQVSALLPTHGISQDPARVRIAHGAQVDPALRAPQGANETTAFGLPGVGDLEVTGLSGRNKFYGVRIGRGEGPKEALEEMARLEQTVEGVPAAGLALKFVDQHAPELREQLPLINAVIDVLSGEVEDVKTRIGQAVLPARP